MTGETIDQPQTGAPPYALWTAALLGGLLLFRLVVLLLNPSGLHGDEAQYWAWAQDPAFGYYSKPPLIAWIIWSTTAVFGDAEWAIRLASPILHTGAALFAFLSARHLFGPKAGWIAATAYALMPGVALSASLISTDAALLFCISVFIFAWVRLRDRQDWRWAALLGSALGFGLLAKYAMIYVLPAFALASLVDAPTRRAVLSAKGVLACALAGLLILPNVIWNARHDFATLVHTTDNANMAEGPQFNPGELLEFLIGQFGVFGPLSFALLLIALWQFRGRLGPFGPWLAVLTLTPILVICVQALLSRANANWAAAAYGAAPILLAGWAVQSRIALRWVGAALTLNLLLNVGPGLIVLSPSLTDSLGLANSVKRQRGWPETVQAIGARFDAGAFDAIAVDNRLMFYATTYYDIEDVAPLYMWRFEPRLNNHAELTSALPEGKQTLLLASYYLSYRDYFERDFETLLPLGREDILLGGGKVRTIWFYQASGYRGPVFRDK